MSSSVFELMQRDLSEGLTTGVGRVLIGVSALAMVACLILAIRGSRLAWAPLALVGTMILVWWAYYRFDGLISNPGLGGVTYVGSGLIVATLLSAVAIFRHVQSR